MSKLEKSMEKFAAWIEKSIIPIAGKIARPYRPRVHAPHYQVRPACQR
jgi:hypothetical protein